MNYIQQGDVLLFPVSSFPDGKPVLNKVLHKGDNHTHSVDGDFLLCEYENETYLNVLSQAVLGHEEHGFSDVKFRTIPKGAYKKRIVMEYDHALEESRKVID